MQFWQKALYLLKRFDWIFIGAMLVLLCMSLAIHYSLAINQTPPTMDDFSKHALTIALGIALFLFFTMIDHRVFHVHPLVYVVIAMLILLAVLLFGSTIQGSKSWFIIGGFSFQPVEVVKLLLIVFIASYLQKGIHVARRVKYHVVTGTITALMMGLILLQPDLGSAMMIFFIWFFLLVVLHAPRWFIAAVLVAVAIAFWFGWMFLFADYQKDRLTTFLNPEQDRLGSGYNITQSIIAVGSGGFWGKGLGFGTQSQLHFLPEVESDFIFAAIAEELGFFGVGILLTAIGVVLWRLLRYAKASRDSYDFIVIMGVGAYLFIQSTLVIGMNIGLLPITGVPLPLLSAGGSSMIVSLAMLGIVHRIGMKVT